MAQASWRRPMVLGLCALVPVALVVLWIVFGGSGEPKVASQPGPDAASSAASPTAGKSGSAATPKAPTASDREGLASLAERQQAIVAERERAAQAAAGASRADRPAEGSDAEGTEPSDAGATDEDAEGLAEAEDSDGEAEGSDGEEAVAEAPSGPTPEEVEELQRLTAAGTPPPEVLQQLMEDEPPMPSPAEIADLRRRTEDLLNFDPELVREVTEQSEKAAPSQDRLDILKARLAAEKADEAAGSGQ